MRAALILTTVILNTVLWISYVRMGVSMEDFGNVRSSLRQYMLVSAGLAYACNLAFILLLSLDRRASEGTLAIATACVAIYYALQLLFVPSVRGVARGMSRNFTRALLIACIVPVVVLAGLAVRMRSMTLSVLGLLVVAHVTVNDAILYGFEF